MSQVHAVETASLTTESVVQTELGYRTNIQYHIVKYISDIYEILIFN